jgi:hypothetical protein
MANKRLAHPPQEIQEKITVGDASRVCNFTPADPATAAPNKAGPADLVRIGT